MRAFVVFFLVFVALLAATPRFGDLPVAHACSCGDCDLVRDSEVIVEGTFLAWDYARDADGSPRELTRVGYYSRPEFDPHERPIVIRFAVSKVYKGFAPAEISISESQYDRELRAEGVPPFRGWEWPGKAGQCFALGSDPTGHSGLIFLVHSDQPGSYRLLVSPEVQVDRSTLPPPHPPAAGNSPTATPLSESSDDWLIVIAIGAGLLLLTLVLLLAGPRNDRPGEVHRRAPEDQPPGSP